MRGALLIMLALAAGCIDYLEPGQPGQARYFAEVRGEAPLPAAAPIADRDGNVYVVHGAASPGRATVYVGSVSGGWSGGCQAHEGDDRHLRGWIGRARAQAWYASGDAIVEVSGADGRCAPVLDRDPVSGANLRFLGVAPWVWETPSRTTTVALVDSSADRRPSWAVVDLESPQFRGLRPFTPEDAAEVVVIGAGAAPDGSVALFLIGYTRADQAVVEGIFVDKDAGELARVPVPGLAADARDRIQGFLQSADGGLFAGLLDDRRLVLVTAHVADTRPVDGFDAAGVHVWGDRAYVVGTSGDQPVVARLGGDGALSPAQPWEASIRAAEALRGAFPVIDERSAPWRQRTWTDPVSALGPLPFVAAQAPHRYAERTTIWLIAGPTYTAGGLTQTSVALVPIGLEYP